ncbi:hypothetical protein OIU35_31450 [Boseaceae bacterium BT-24-1]|nr:hypothetical protein [Boseaceae bacterium BT-24-1]
MRLTKAQLEIAKRLGDQEALRQAPYFVVGHRTIGDVSMFEKMAAKGAVRLETVGASTFAKLTEAGHAAVVALATVKETP